MRLSNHLDKGFWTAAANLVKVIYGIGFVFWLARILPNEDFSSYMIVQATFLVILQLTLALSMSGFIKYYYDEEFSVDELRFNSILLFFVWGIAFNLFILVAQNWLGEFTQINPVLFRFIPVIFLTAFLKALTNEFFRVTQNLKNFFYSESLYFVLHAGLVFILYFRGSELNPSIILTMMAVAYLVSSLVSLVLAKPKFDLKNNYSPRTLGVIFSYNKHAFLTSASSNIFDHLDKYILAHFAGPVVVAKLVVLRQFGRVFSFYRQAMAIIIFPAFAKLHSQKKISLIQPAFEKIVFISTLLIASYVVMVFIFGDQVFTYILRKHENIGFVLNIYMVTGFFVIWHTISDYTLFGIGEPRYVFRIRSIVATINIGLSILLIKYFDLLGAVISILVTDFLLAIVSTSYVKKFVPVTLKGVALRYKDMINFAKSILEKFSKDN